MKLTDYIGETTSYDKKVALERKDPLSWLKSVSAFANTFGGKLLYGVGDDGELVGLSDAERDAEDLSEIIKSCLDPVPTFKLEFVREEGKTFMVVSIQAGDEAPYYVFLKGHRDAYVRVGNESVKASSIDLKRLVLKGEKRSWDSLLSSFNKENFSFERLRAEYFKRVKTTFVESDFESLNELEEKDFTRSSHKAKSITLTKTGMAEARRILEKYHIADRESLKGTEDWPGWLEDV